MTTDREREDELPGSAGTAVPGRLLAVALVVAVIVIGVAGFLVLDIGGPRPLPGAPLSIRTGPPASTGAACGSEVLPPARLLVVGDGLTLIAANGGADMAVVWPAGYAAREAGGRGGLYDPSGYLVAQEGATIQERFFGAVADDGAFHVCRIARD